jgi:hypothetical protein
MRIPFILRSPYFRLLIAALLSLLCGWWLSGGTLWQKDPQWHLHDTYFILSRWWILLPLFLGIAFFLGFIPILLQKQPYRITIRLQALLGLAFVVSLTLMIRALAPFTLNTTWYPPLSALGADQTPVVSDNRLIGGVVNSLVIVQALALIALIGMGYRTRLKRKTGL